MLQRSLTGKRYLIVLDDMWKSEAWDAVRLCFPSENKGSGLLMTTRNTEVARYAGTENLSLHMAFMYQDDSWNIFKSAAFANEALPFEYENIGKQIADECHRLPLTIVVVAGLLKSKKTIEDWKSVAEDVKSFVTNNPDERCSRVLGLTYNHLTNGLKTCLLYYGTFPEDTEIPVKHLMRLWMAEGFLNLEREAEKCLQELVDRCLDLVCKKSLDGTKIRSCKVNDLIHDLCLREDLRGNVFIMNEIVFEKSDANQVSSECQSLMQMHPFKRLIGDEIDSSPYGLYRDLPTPVHRQLRYHDNNDLFKRTRSIFIFDGYFSPFILDSALIHFKLLKVLDLSYVSIYSFPLPILNLIWLRLWNLQTFYVKRSFLTFPGEIWGLMQLRHLKLPTFYLPDCPSGSVDKGRHLGFSNLQTISYLSPSCCTKEVIMGIQNVKKLEISGFKVIMKVFWTLGFSTIYLLSVIIPSAKSFPATLKKLKLKSTSLSWSDLDIIAELPNLEVLKLISGACRGGEWHPNVRGFTRLKLLLIEHSSLKYWKATDDNFPVLERLLIRSCYHLTELPIEFAYIHSLQLIELRDCFPELEESAARIQKEQEDFGNNPMDVRTSNPRK
ncbi:hypothetical protein P3S67_008270 [Capsicum chacoense]